MLWLWCHPNNDTAATHALYAVGHEFDYQCDAWGAVETGEYRTAAGADSAWTGAGVKGAGLLRAGGDDGRRDLGQEIGRFN